MTLHVPSFGGGVVLAGSAESRKIDEVLECDSYDITEGGQLVVASDLTALFNANDDIGARLNPIYGIALMGLPDARRLLVIGFGNIAHAYAQIVQLETGINGVAIDLGLALANGYIVTTASFPFVDRNGVQNRPIIICIAAREGYQPRTGVKLYYVADIGGFAARDPDWLGTGASGLNEAPGTKSKSLYPRGVTAYNSHLFLWGFDNKDAVNGEGSNRLMFSNTGNPAKIGYDAPGGAGDRDFVDSDAINVGSAGEIIRGCLSWAGKLWIGTNEELHWLAGYGRESFITNGSTKVRKSKNIVGPHALIEGPDGLLYGVSTEGLWSYDGGAVAPLYRKLVDFRGQSLGWWDLIWQDSSRAAAYPGTTNQDLVWMLADPDTMQVWVVIPWCNAAAGYGYGTDTVVIKYHTQTAGFTRQVFTGQILTHGLLMHRETFSPTRRIIAHPQLVTTNIKVYGAKATAIASPVMPAAAPAVTAGEYAPFGADSVGVLRRLALSLSWDADSALPIVFQFTPTVEGQALTGFKISIQPAAPGAPGDDDIWLDTSGSDLNIGTGTAGAIVPAAADYVLKRWSATWNKWVLKGNGGGEKGTRVTIPFAHKGVPGTRYKYRLATTSAAGRFQIEGFGLIPPKEE